MSARPRPIYYDTETTGLSSKNDRIVEIAAYDPDRDCSFVKLVNPGMPIPFEAMSVHKITDQMVASEPDFGQIGREFVDFCGGDGSDVILIAHNNDSFDVLFLKQEFSRFEIEMPNWKFLDTLKWARRYRRDLPRHSLQFLREIYGISANTAHRALDDVVVLHQVFNAMIDDLSIETAYQLLNEAREQDSAPPPVMPFGKHQGKPLSQVPRSYVQWLKRDGAFDKPENQGLRAGFEKAGMLSPR